MLDKILIEVCAILRQLLEPLKLSCSSDEGIQFLDSSSSIEEQTKSYLMDDDYDYDDDEMPELSKQIGDVIAEPTSSKS